MSRGPLERTLRIESPPLLVEELFSSIHASADAPSVVGAGHVDVGAVIVQLYAAGEASRLPTASLARTWNWCEPVASAVYWRGDVQAANADPSSEHSKAEPDSLEEKENDALVEVVVAGGAASMVVSGATVSIVHPYCAGVASAFPTPSVARTRNWWVPLARPVYWRGDKHVTNGAPSSEHSNVEPDSLAEKLKLALVLAVAAGGPAEIVVSGATVSIVQLAVAGVASTLPAASVARTRNWCVPSARLA